MGLLDSIGGAVLKSVLGGQDSSILSSVLGEVLGGGAGGLSSIVAKLEQAGMGELVRSWLGSGENQPISADQINEVLNSDQIKQIAEKFGIPADDVLGTLAQILPGVIDKASPDGRLSRGV
jgi:uncharacterized protein YidB (DUF937 family)